MRPRIKRTVSVRSSFSYERIIYLLSSIYELPELLVRIIYRKYNCVLSVVKYELSMIKKVKNELEFIDSNNYCF